MVGQIRDLLHGIVAPAWGPIAALALPVVILAVIVMGLQIRQLAQRLEHVELAGEVERLRSSFVGGVKHMPISYKMGPAKS